MTFRRIVRTLALLLLLQGGLFSQTAVLTVTFVDVGQADCVVVQQGDQALLVDAGNNGDREVVLETLARLGVTRLVAAVGTHVHEDHIGSLDAVLATLPVGTFYFPRQTSTTKTFRDLVTVVRDRGLKLTVPHPGEGFDLGLARVQFLSPARADYEEANDFSVVLRVTFGSTAFLFTGDASLEAEAEMVASGLPLAADVLKVGHHGSATASSAAFLRAVKPRWAVISVGNDNHYGHPTAAALGRLAATGAKVLRTDAAGTITAVSDGTAVTVASAR